MQNRKTGFVEKKQGDVAWLEASVRTSPVTFGFFGRNGGVSPAPYNTLNVGGLSEDSEVNVETNRQIALDALNLSHNYLALRQVHGDRCLCVTQADIQDPVRREALQFEAERGADAFVCVAPNVPCMIVTADCAPIVICAPHGFALVHSGWKGTLQKIAAKSVRLLQEVSGDNIAHMHAYIGPCIGPKDFEVSNELADEFVSLYGAGVLLSFRHLDLAYAISKDLEAAGMLKKHINSTNVSTASQLTSYFSYRMEGQKTGRQATIACLNKEQPA